MIKNLENVLVHKVQEYTNPGISFCYTTYINLYIEGTYRSISFLVQSYEDETKLLNIFCVSNNLYQTSEKRFLEPFQYNEDLNSESIFEIRGFDGKMMVNVYIMSTADLYNTLFGLRNSLFIVDQYLHELEAVHCLIDPVELSDYNGKYKGPRYLENNIKLTSGTIKNLNGLYKACTIILDFCDGVELEEAEDLEEVSNLYALHGVNCFFKKLEIIREDLEIGPCPNISFKSYGTIKNIISRDTNGTMQHLEISYSSDISAHYADIECIPILLENPYLTTYARSIYLARLSGLPTSPPIFITMKKENLIIHREGTYSYLHDSMVFEVLLGEI